ncbi:hypothetical protein VC83_02205 [Pseudogymnoascus destructans]|uniref:Uncharacterized protein n=1 Tax=Pseudogymnoascus destructans TaxID=655981 RepID=A0A177AGT0_9PEZI|nr:uncharacterized protein VC83_02205 [Pseudogymnoascus destructans]OAF61316.1 hypothetical protein VC83_02205 [Pseudogymnoascus destructans]
MDLVACFTHDAEAALATGNESAASELGDALRSQEGHPICLSGGGGDVSRNEGVASSAVRRAANSSQRNQGSYSHQDQHQPTNPNTESNKKTYRDASQLHSAVPTLGAGRGPDAIVRLDPTSFCLKAVQTEHSERSQKGPGGRRNRHCQS